MEVRFCTTSWSHHQIQVIRELSSRHTKCFTDQSFPTVADDRTTNFFRDRQPKSTVRQDISIGMNNQDFICCVTLMLIHSIKVGVMSNSTSLLKTFCTHRHTQFIIRNILATLHERKIPVILMVTSSYLEDRLSILTLYSPEKELGSSSKGVTSGVCAQASSSAALLVSRSAA